MGLESEKSQEEDHERLRDDTKLQLKQLNLGWICSDWLRIMNN